MPEAVPNPYQAPESPTEIVVTARNFTPIQCLFLFLLAGGVSGLLGAPPAVLANALGSPPGAVLFVPGLLFGLAFWITTHLCIGTLNVFQMIALICGCLAGFVAFGTAYELFQPVPRFSGSPWNWANVRPCLYGPAIGLLLIAGSVRAIGGYVRWRVFLTVWLAGTLLGFASTTGFHELESVLGLEVALFVAVAFFQTTTLGLIGWQLATARSSVR